MHREGGARRSAYHPDDSQRDDWTVETLFQSRCFDELIDELFLHGILHLHDYDHQNKKESLRMKRIERKLFSNRPN